MPQKDAALFFSIDLHQRKVGKVELTTTHWAGRHPIPRHPCRSAQKLRERWTPKDCSFGVP